MAEKIELVEIDLESVNKQLEESIELIDDLTQSNKELKKELKKTDEQLEEVGTTRAEVNKQIAFNTVELQKQKKVRNDSIKLIKSEVNSLNQLRERNKQLRTERNNLNLSTKEGQKRLKEINDELDKNDKKITKNSSSLEKQKRGIGDYGKAIEALPGPLQNVAGGIMGVIKASKAFLATPIGLALAALGAAVGAVTSFFKGSAEGQERWNRIMQKSKAVAGVFGDAIRDVGKGIVDFIDNIRDSEDGLKGWAKGVKENAQKRFRNFRDDIKDKGFWQTLKDNGKDAIDAVVGKVDELNEKIKENARLGEQLANRQNALRRDEIEALVTRAQLQTEIADLILTTRDRENVSSQEALENLKRAQVLKQQEFDEEVRLAKERLELKKFENSLSDSTLEDLEEQAQLEADLIRLEKTRADQLRELLNREIELKNRMRAEEKAYQAEQDKLVDESIDEELARIDEEIANTQEYADKEIEIWEKKEEEKSKIEEDGAKKRQDVLKQSLNFVGQAFNTLFDFITTSNQMSLDAQLAAAGDNQEKIDQIRAEFAKKQKRAAIGQAIANGALAIIKAFSTLGPIAGAASAAIITATTGLQIAKIRQQEFAHGGEVKAFQVSGPSHSQGGIPLHIGGNYAGEIEGNEGVYVVNKRDNAAAVAALSSINSKHGKAFAPRSYMQDGGEAAAQTNTGLSFEEALALAEARPIQVQVTDINDAQAVDVQVTQNAEI